MYNTRCSCQISITLDFPRHTFGKDSNVKFNEYPSVGVELFHADGRTDKTKLITAFRNFENAHKKKERNKTRDKEGKQKVEDGRERG